MTSLPDPDGSADKLEEFLGEFEELIATDPEQALAFALRVDDQMAEEPLVRMAKAHAIWASRGAPAARREFEGLLATEPDFADAHYALAEVCGELGDEKRRTAHLLTVLKLDRADDLAEDFDPKPFEPLIVEAAKKTLNELPPPYRERLSGIPVLLEERPSESLVRDGFDPRALGMFEGPMSERGGIAVPTRIVLFTANLPTAASDEEDLRAEVEVTILHEIGQFFALEEEELARLGLE